MELKLTYRELVQIIQIYESIVIDSDYFSEFNNSKTQEEIAKAVYFNLKRAERIHLAKQG